MTTETIIDQAINSVETPDTPVDTSTEAKIETTDEPQAAKVEEDVPFPKKAVNAISRRDKQIGKYRAELAAARAELAKYQTQGNQAQKPTESGPKETDFDNYGEYLKAVAKHEARQEYQGERQRTEEAQKTAQEKEWISQREEAVAEQAQQLLQTNPEYQQILTEHSDILDAMPPHIERAFLEAENAPLAFVVLAKEGKLESLMTMSPYQAAMAIAKAEDRGAVQAKAKVTNAPKPMASAKGTGQVTKSLSSMSAKELTAWARS